MLLLVASFLLTFALALADISWFGIAAIFELEEALSNTGAAKSPPSSVHTAFNGAITLREACRVQPLIN